MPKLKILSGPQAGREREFSSTIVVGRSGTDFDVADDEISRTHVELTPTPSGVEVKDLGSSNGSWIEGRRLSEPTVLTEATTLQVGQTRLQVVPGSPADATRTRIRSAPLKVEQPRLEVSFDDLQPDPAIGRPSVTASQPATSPPRAFAPSSPTRKPRRGPATRLLAPAALTALTIVGTAVALIVYFAERTV